MKKLITLLLVLVVALTLTACKEKESEYNTTTPYGTLTDAEYASVGTHKITQKETKTFYLTAGAFVVIICKRVRFTKCYLPDIMMIRRVRYDLCKNERRRSGR